MERDLLKIVFAGSVDHGKSTLIARLLMETGCVSKQRLLDMRRVWKEFGKSAELAYLADQLKEERLGSLTIDTTKVYFKTKAKDYVAIDVPGHAEFIKNMITGATHADAAILVIDAAEGLKEQTRRHVFLLDLVDIRKVIVVFNKMDSVKYSREVFIKLKSDTEKFLKNFKIEPKAFVPVSAKDGINISKRSLKLGWYKGDVLLKAMDKILLDREKKNKPLRFFIQDVFDIEGSKVALGRVSCGIAVAKEEVVLLPSGKHSRINSIAKYKTKNKLFAVPGESVGLELSDNLEFKRGDVVVSRNKMPELTDVFKATLFWMSDSPLKVGRRTDLLCATQKVACRVERIFERIDTSSLIKEDSAGAIEANEAGIVLLRTEGKLVLEDFSLMRESGRFILEDNTHLVAAGIFRSE